MPPAPVTQFSLPPAARVVRTASSFKASTSEGTPQQQSRVQCLMCRVCSLGLGFVTSAHLRFLLRPSVYALEPLPSRLSRTLSLTTATLTAQEQRVIFL